jgi:hypothetical protein
MTLKNRLAIGSFLSVFGALGIILGPVFNLTQLVSPWSFLVGFFLGLSAGLGVALSISGLISSRKNLAGK